jgi:hypothetical protein
MPSIILSKEIVDLNHTNNPEKRKNRRTSVLVWLVFLIGFTIQRDIPYPSTEEKENNE